MTKDTLKGDLPVLVEADRPRGANSFLRPFSRLTMPLKQLSRVYPAASEGSLARAAGDRAVERAGDSSTALFRICLLTGGDDRSYALGMACALVGQGISVDFIGSDKLDAPELHRTPLIAFLNLRGDQNEDAPLLRKVVRILTYYARLASYVPRSQAQIFHLLWNNKFEHFDRTALMLYYRLFGKRIVFTAHNVNARKRDGCDSWLNRFTLRIQYPALHPYSGPYGSDETGASGGFRNCAGTGERHPFRD